jgi:hypothetical protein
MSGKKTQNQIYLVYRESHSGGEPENPEDRWTSHSPLYTEFYPQALYLNLQSFQETINVSWEPKLDQKVWIVVVRYQSGNTFGTSHGNWTIVGAYLTSQDAEAIATIINKYPGKADYSRFSEKRNKSDRELLEEAIQPYVGEHFYPSWFGYFERYEGVEVHEILLASGPSKNSDGDDNGDDNGQHTIKYVIH